jgi:hypothetical protein
MIKAETCGTLDNKHRPMCTIANINYLQFHSLHLDFPFGEMRIWEYSPLKQHPVTEIRITRDIPLAKYC